MKKLTKEQFEKIGKTYDLLKSCDTRTKMARIGLRTLGQFNDAWQVLKNIYINDLGATIDFNVACFFKKQGFRLVDNWIGWTIRV